MVDLHLEGGAAEPNGPHSLNELYEQGYIYAGKPLDMKLDKLTHNRWTTV